VKCSELPQSEPVLRVDGVDGRLARAETVVRSIGAGRERYKGSLPSVGVGTAAEAESGVVADVGQRVRLVAAVGVGAAAVADRQRPVEGASRYGGGSFCTGWRPQLKAIEAEPGVGTGVARRDREVADAG
jgi:hypothetical protein